MNAVEYIIGVINLQKKSLKQISRQNKTYFFLSDTYAEGQTQFGLQGCVKQKFMVFISLFIFIFFALSISAPVSDLSNFEFIVNSMSVLR